MAPAEWSQDWCGQEREKLAEWRLELATLRGKPRPDLRECENGDGEGELEREMWPAPCGSLLFIAEIRHSDQSQLTDYSPSLRAEQGPGGQS